MSEEKVDDGKEVQPTTHNRSTTCGRAKVTTCSCFGVLAISGPLAILYPGYTLYIVGPSSCLIAVCMLYRFPSLVELLHRRAFSIEDLDEDDDDSHAESLRRARLRAAFRHILILTSSICLGVLVDFALMRRRDDMSTVEFLGVIGGLLSLMKRVHMWTGRFLLQTLSCCAPRRKRRMSGQLDI